MQEISAHKVCKELINHNLYLFAWPLKVYYGLPFVNNTKIKKYIYSHLTKYICTQGIILHPATVYLCIFKELYLFNFKVLIYLLTVKEIWNSFKEHIFIHNKKVLSFETIIFFHGIIFISRNLSVHSRKYILVQGKHINSGKFYPFKEIYSLRKMYSFKFKAVCSFKETIFIEHCCVRGNSRINDLFKNCPQPLYDNYKFCNYYLLNKV